jgi:methionyl-tRNA formyltransferase
MLKIGLICNTTAAFPLLQWLQSQGLLVGVAVLNQQSDFLSDANFMAKQLSIPICLIEKSNFNQQLTNWQVSVNAELVLVLGFPFRIKSQVFESPKYGYFNIHFGKLPEYGGSFPVFWQIYSLEKVGELTIHKMDKSYDTGPIAVKIPFEITANQTFGMLEANYASLAINGSFQLISSLLLNNLVLIKQKETQFKYLPKPQLSDLIILWENHKAEKIVALTKATNPWNRGAISRINNLDIKVIDAEVGPITESINYGEIIEISEKGIVVVCAQNNTLIIKITYSQFGYLLGETNKLIGLKVGVCFEKLIG